MSRFCTVHHLDAFSSVPDMGNPAGVVEDAGLLDEKDMRRIAARVGFNETAFILPSSRADFRLRFFTPGKDIP